MEEVEKIFNVMEEEILNKIQEHKFFLFTIERKIKASFLDLWNAHNVVRSLIKMHEELFMSFVHYELIFYGNKYKNLLKNGLTGFQCITNKELELIGGVLEKRAKLVNSIDSLCFCIGDEIHGRMLRGKEERNIFKRPLTRSLKRILDERMAKEPYSERFHKNVDALLTEATREAI